MRRYHFSLLLSASLFVAAWITRPDFEEWHLLPSFGLWGSGHIIIIRLGGRQKSPERVAAEERLAIRKLEDDYRYGRSWLDKHFGLVFVIGFVLFMGFVFGATWLGTYGPDGVREWLDLFGCSC